MIADTEYAAQETCWSMLQRRFVVVALAVVALGLSGCPALMVGSLGYEGYQYEKTGQLPGMPPTKKPTSQPSSTGDDVE